MAKTSACSCIAVLLILHGCCTADAANILMSALYGEGSHFLAASRIGLALMERGHNVTFLIGEAYRHRASDPKYSKFSFEVFPHQLPVGEVRAVFGKLNELAFEEISSQWHMLEITKLLTSMMTEDCGAVLSNEGMLSRLEGVDAIAMDVEWPCAIFIRQKLEQTSRSGRSNRSIKMIAMSATPPFSGFLHSGGSPFNPAYQPELSSGLSSHMDFWERLTNLLVFGFSRIMGEIIFMNTFREVGLSHNLSVAKGLDMTYSVADFDLFLTNIDFASDFPAPLAPNVIPVGGLTATPPSNMESDLEEFVQSSGEHGVVVFTLGTYLASITTIKPEIVEMFSDAFRRLPQKVLWQLKELPDWELPPNVKTMAWLPQNDLLGHPKTRAFVFQGGNNGFQEACYHGVPVVVLPLHGDQVDVAARIVSRGLGRKIDKHNLSADIIYEALSEVLNNPSYNAVAKEVSAMYKAQPMSPRERAAFWVDHVIKFGGSYMRSPARDLNFFQYYLLDVIAFLTLVVVVVIVLIFYILRFFLSLCCRIVWRKNKPKSD